MQASRRAAFSEEYDDDEELKPVLPGTGVENTNKTGDEDVEMRDHSEGEEDDNMSEGDKDEDLSEDSDSDEDDDMGGGSEKGEGQREDKPFVLVKAWIQMSATADDLDITLYLMKPHYKFSWEQSQRNWKRIGPVRTRDDLVGDDTLSVHTDTVWSKGSSHFVSDTIGASGPRGL